MLELVAGAAAAVLQPAEPATIVVTGRGLDEDPRVAGASLTLDRSAIERSASGRMEDVLRDVAGLTSFRRSDSRSAHPTSQGLTLRGLGGNAASRVALTLDGVPQADPFGGWIAFTALDPNAIDRIRITRGAGGIEAGALAGLIDIDSRPPSDPIDASISVGSRKSVDARALAGHRWSEGFATLSGSFSQTWTAAGRSRPAAPSGRCASPTSASSSRLQGSCRPPASTCARCSPPPSPRAKGSCGELCTPSTPKQK